MNDGSPNLGLRSIVDHVTAFGDYYDFTIFDVRVKNELPDLSYDVFISSGGPGDPRVGDGVWDLNYYAWLRSVVDHNAQQNSAKKFVFLICHSFQMGVLFFKTGALHQRFHISFGIFPCYLTGNGLDEDIFAGLPNPIYIADFRNYEVLWPRFESKTDFYPRVLAVEQLDVTQDRERAIMAIRFTPEIVGTQFHPEAYAEGMFQYFNQEERRLQVTTEHVQHPKKIALTSKTILPNFLHNCVEYYLPNLADLKIRV